MQTVHIETTSPAPAATVSSSRLYLFFDRVGWKKSFVILFVTLLLLSVALPILAKTFLVEAYKIPTSSMAATLQEGDRILVNKLVYWVGSVAVGDVVVFRVRGIPTYDDPSKPYHIRRVAGLPGDTLEITPEGRLLRNGAPLEQPEIFAKNKYTPANNRTTFKVPEGKVFVLGDNSTNSFDSRSIGGVPINDVIGRAFYRYWPPHRSGFIRGEVLPGHEIPDAVTDGNV